MIIVLYNYIRINPKDKDINTRLSPDTSVSHKTVIIPDIHNKWHAAEQIIKNEDPDLVVFLGDYFDGFDDDPTAASETAQWLADSVANKPKRIHIIGNHDLHYMTNNRQFQCTGYAKEKRDAISAHHIDWSRIKIYYWLEDSKSSDGSKNTGWLCTHAGFTDKLFKQQRISESETVKDVLRRGVGTDMGNMYDETVPHPFLQQGQLRGGTGNAVGGLVWCNYEEFEDIHNTSQIFGHTRGPKVRHGMSDSTEHYCIDTVLRNYAVCENYNTMTIKSTYMQ